MVSAVGIVTNYKSNRNRRRAMEKRTVCPYDCPDSCSMIAEIENGKLISVKGDPEHPRTCGFLCRKTQHYERMVGHPDRILYPLKRTGAKGSGEFERISWEEALTIITDNWKKIIEEYGAQAILPYSYAGTEGVLQKNCGEAFFHYLGASRLRRTICSVGRSAGWKAVMGNTLAMPAHRFSECDRILVWSSNLAATRIHEIPYIKAAREKGARVTLIEVYESPASAHVDETILLRPGTDGALAMAMLHVLEKEGLTDPEYISEHVTGYEMLKELLPTYTPEWAEAETGIPAERIRELALSYGHAKRPAILLGAGVSRHTNGAMSVRCICALPAAIGSLKDGFGVGGFSTSGQWIDVTRVSRPDFDRGSRILNMMQLASALDPEKTMDPPVKSLYVYNSNPMNVATNLKRVEELMKREDLFTVVHERFMTDTAMLADVILPAVFSLESEDIFLPYGCNAIQYAPAILPAPGKCRSNWNTFAALAKKLEWEEPYFRMSEKEMCDMLLDRSYGQLRLLSEEEWEKLLAGYGIEKRLACEILPETPGQKVLLYNEEVRDALVQYKKVQVKEALPLHLVAAPSIYTLNSTFTMQEDLAKARGKMTLLMNAEDAKKRGIADGDQVVCENELAKVLFYAKVGDNLLPGTVVAEGVYSKARSLNGLTANALFSEELSDLGEATTMNGNFVEVRRWI